LLTVFVVSEPLFDRPRPLVEAAEGYLLALETRASQMAESDNGQVLSDGLLITTTADR